MGHFGTANMQLAEMRHIQESDRFRWPVSGAIAARRDDGECTRTFD